MNIKITKEQHQRLVDSKAIVSEYVFGSHLFGLNTSESDTDLLRIYNPLAVFKTNDLLQISHLPNIHSFQYDDVENNQQIIWMTQQQFKQGAVTGDGIINLDICIFYDLMEIGELFTYNIIKAYLGVAKRDLKQFTNPKKLFHAHKSLYIASSLMDKELPSISNINSIGKGEYSLTADLLIENEKHARIKLNKMLDDGLIMHYHNPLTTDDDLLNLMVNSNNVREFKYV